MKGAILRQHCRILLLGYVLMVFSSRSWISAPSTRDVNTPKSVSQKHGYLFPRYGYNSTPLIMPFPFNALKAVHVDL